MAAIWEMRIEIQIRELLKVNEAKQNLERKERKRIEVEYDHKA